MIRLAREFGLLPQEYMERVSHRWHGQLLAWLVRQCDHPTLDQQYMMSIAFAAARGPVKDADRLKLEDFKLKFPTKATPPPNVEQETAWAKAKWGAALGVQLNGK